MSNLLPIAISLHLLAALVWVGGMFFAHQVLRPVAVARLEPPQRLPLWIGVFSRFFPWVWLAVILLPATGYWMVFAVFGGMGAVGLHVHLMQGIGWLMIVLYVYIYFLPFRQMKRRVIEGDWPAAAAELATIRKVVGTNLLLGLLVVVIGSGGRYF
ncbi:CopD family protein [Thiohalobacter sp. IOR34]|uniref:CopD family protein n=1 Tax=Thiohalobacter sp. IOR34 TaxID=3057176 RepID=UPI0025B0B26F|nr:CopD family protein [Thiohalobacter sp. IOR34]WJW75840.1 CopD family protein [Thiohalobacter sp. IOR34]